MNLNVFDLGSPLLRGKFHPRLFNSQPYVTLMRCSLSDQIT